MDRAPDRMIFNSQRPQRPARRVVLAASAVLLSLLAPQGPVLAFPDGQQARPTTDEARQSADPRDKGNRHVISQLSPEGREILRGAMLAGRDSTAFAQLRTIRREVLLLVSADKVDARALRAKLAEERTLSDQLQALRHEALIDAALKLSVEDRKLFGQWLTRLGGSPDGRPPRGPRPPGGPDDRE